MGPPHSSNSSSTQRRRLALFSLLLTLLTLTGTTLLSLTLLPAAFSSNTPLLPFLTPPRSIVLLLQQTSLLTLDDGLSSQTAVPTSIQAGWALVAAVGSLVGVLGSGALLLVRRSRGDRYARAALALFCVCLGAAWGGGLVTGTTQILLLWVPHDHLTASCKAAAASNAGQASQCSRRLYALLGIYVGVLLAWGVLAGALLEAQRRICRGLSGEGEMRSVGKRGRDVEVKVEDAGERTTPLPEAKASFPAARPQVTFVVDAWPRQAQPAMASPQRHPTILRPASARSTPTASAFSSPALSSSSSLSSARTLVWSSSPATKQKYSPYSSTTPSRSSLLSKSPIVY